jgi:hypothetical protein
MTTRSRPARGQREEVVANWVRLNRRAYRAACENRRVRGFPLLAAVLAGTVLLAAGCGGTTTYSEAATRSCLKQVAVKVGPVPNDDFVASAAEGGAFTARFKDDKVTVSFGLDRKGAERIVRGYQRFRGKNIGLEDVLKPKQNAVMLWALHPPEAYLQTIEGCLK